MRWQERFTREERNELRAIEEAREKLALAQREIYDRCRLRWHSETGGVQFTTSRGDVFFVDPDDAEWVSRHRWQSVGSGAGRVDRDPYVASKLNGKRAYLHRIGVEAPVGLYVDHIDGDTLNNRRANLRLVTHAENMKYRAERLKSNAILPAQLTDMCKPALRAETERSVND